jgi:hypothetical protein
VRTSNLLRRIERFTSPNVRSVVCLAFDSSYAGGFEAGAGAHGFEHFAHLGVLAGAVVDLLDGGSGAAGDALAAAAVDDLVVAALAGGQVLAAWGMLRHFPGSILPAPPARLGWLWPPNSKTLPKKRLTFSTVLACALKLFI